MKNYGYISSIIPDDVKKFEVSKSKPLPLKYSYRDFLPPVLDQGSDPYCIPYSVSTWLNWKENMKIGGKKDFHIKYSDIYKSKTVVGNGMTYREALNYLKSHGVKTDKGVMKISEFGYVTSTALLKQAIIANGPCFGSLPVYDETSETFWKKIKSSPEGWHSVTIVGWDAKGFIIRNSWGESWGDDGYGVVPYLDASSFKEIWTILG